MTKTHYLALAAAIASTAFATGFQSNKGKPTESKTSNLSVKTSGSKKVNIDIPLGQVHLKTGRGSEVTVHAVRSYRGPATEAAKRWMSDSILRVEQKNGTVMVDDVPFGKRNSHINGNFNPELDLEINIPEGLDVTLSVDCGTVDGGGHYSTLKGSVDAGTLKLKGLDCDSSFDLHVDAGEVGAGLASIPSRNSSVQTDIGALTLDLPRSADADVTAQTDIGKIDGLPASKKKAGEIELGDQRHARFGKGGAKLSLQVSTGSIRVGSPDRAEALANEEPISIATEIDGVAYPESRINQLTAADKKEMQKAIKEAQKEVSKAMKDIKFSSDFAGLHEDIQKEIDQAMKEAHAEVAQAMREAHEEVRRAMEESKNEIDDVKLSKDIEALVKSALDTAMAATEQALKATDFGMKQADKAMKKAAKKKG